MKCPCMDCADRQAICHDTCSRFAEYRRPLDAASAQRVQVQQAQLALQDMNRSRHLTMRRMARRCAAARE